MDRQTLPIAVGQADCLEFFKFLRRKQTVNFIANVLGAINF